MNKKIAMKWVKALRSGKYRQGSGLLKDSSGAYCCLGVLQGPILHRSVKSRGGLTDATCEHLRMHPGGLGQPTVGRIRIGSRSYATLAAANDGGATFKSIANWIEKNWWLL